MMRKTLSVLLAVLILAAAGTCAALEPYGDEPTIAAKGCVVYEYNSHELLYSKGGDTRLYPASTTKIMTALLLLEYGHLTEVVTCSQAAISTVPASSSIAGLKTGEEMSLYDLLICLLVPSGNDAANVIAEAVGGTIPDFIKLMNRRAKELGCTGTNFVNAHGFHDDEHYTTVNDMLKITLAAMEYPVFVEICGMARASVPATNKARERSFNSTNFMISNTETSAYLYSYCTGGKTGSTSQSGNCFIGFAKKGDLYLISVMLGSRTDYTRSGVRQIRSFLDTEKLFDWGFSKFSYRTIVSAADPVAEVKVALSDGKDYVVLKPDRDVLALLHRSVSEDIFSTVIKLDDDVSAPVYRGDVLGHMTVYKNGEPIDTLRLLATEDVSRSETLFILQEIRRIFHEPWMRWVLLGAAGFVLLYIVYMILHNRRRQKKLAMRRRHAGPRR